MPGHGEKSALTWAAKAWGWTLSAAGVAVSTTAIQYVTVAAVAWLAHRGEGLAAIPAGLGCCFTYLTCGRYWRARCAELEARAYVTAMTDAIRIQQRGADVARQAWREADRTAAPVVASPDPHLN